VSALSRLCVSAPRINRTIQRVQFDLFRFSAFRWISAQVYYKI
jgi:hypothetical protein